MKITLTESTYYANHYDINYEIEKGCMFEPSQDLLNRRLTAHSFNEGEVIEVVAIIQKDYETALSNKKVKIQQAETLNNELAALFPMLSFEVKPNI